MDIIKQLADLGIHITDPNRHTRTLCPQCSPARKKNYLKSLSVEPSGTGAKFKCFHCPYFGVVGEAGVSSAPKVFKKPAYIHDDSLDPIVPLWFASRGIKDEAILKRNRIGYKKVFIPQIGAETTAISFPYLRGGEVINVKYRTKDKDFRLESGAELCLYGLDDIAGDTLYWVEGEIDKLSLEVAGATSCVSVPNGAPAVGSANLDRHFSYLDGVDLSTIKKHVILTDNDAPGLGLKKELIERLGVENCYEITFPDGCKDANEILVKLGPEVLREFILNFTPVPVEGIVSADDVLANLLDYYENGREKGVQPGTAALAAKYTVRKGYVTIVTGIPSHGKSSWVDWVCFTLAERYNWSFGVFSPENAPTEEHTRKFAEIRTGKPFVGLDRMTVEELIEANDWVGKHFHFIDPESKKIANILSRAKTLITRYGIDGLIIDPWNTLDPGREKGLSETEHISQTLLTIQTFARKNNIHIWVVAHPTKMPNVEKTDTEPVATLYNIAGSRAFYERADVGITVWRDKNKPEMPVQIHIKKIRFKQDGEEGVVEMGFDRKTNRYSDYSEPEGDF